MKRSTETSQDRVLARLLACERALLDAYVHLRGYPQLAAHGVRTHGRHIESLLAFVAEPPTAGRPDDVWLKGASLAEAELACHETWHDALLDLRPEAARYVRDHMLRDHHDLLRRWQEVTGESFEPFTTF